MYQDTIAAISTPVGQGGIGIVRLSGPEALAIGSKMFTGRLKDRYLAYGHIKDPGSGEVIDEVLAAFMAKPGSYTREDVVELNCHGGPLPLQRILEAALRCGARLAEPGEFTLRAFLNGRLDLSQAEAVLDIVRARTAASLRIAVGGLRGRLSQPLQELRTQLMSALAYLTVRIDFPEDEVGTMDIVAALKQCRHILRGLISSADTGMAYRQGVRTAILGRPNVGKSSLLNCLLGENRAIVTPYPGTTRDTVEEVLNLEGIPLLLVDTAGIAPSQHPVESLGVERSRRAAATADLVLLVVDCSEPLTLLDEDIQRMVEDRPGIAVANKVDLPKRADLSSLPWPVVYASALTGEGIEELKHKMISLILGGRVVSSDVPLVSNPRHKEALERAERLLARAVDGAESSLAEDFIAIDVTSALGALGEITGETVGEELLETIFGQFCIGK